MALRYFGQDFTYDFYVLESDAFEYENLPSTPDSVYLYDGRPTEEAASLGTSNSAATVIEGPIAVWADTADARGKRISFSAVDEPADINDIIKKYYVVINLTLDSGALAPIIKEITLQRLRSQESIIDVSVSDMLIMEPMIAVEFPGCIPELEAYIEGAIEEVKYILDGCKRGFEAYTNPGVLNRAVIKLAISQFYFAQSRDVRDIHYANGLRFKEDFAEAQKRIHLEFDDDNDGSPDGVVSSPKGIKSIRILR